MTARAPPPPPFPKMVACQLVLLLLLRMKLRRLNGVDGKHRAMPREARASSDARYHTCRKKRNHVYLQQPKEGVEKREARTEDGDDVEVDIV